MGRLTEGLVDGQEAGGHVWDWQADQRRLARGAVPCPRPDKRRYASKREAAHHLRQIEAKARAGLLAGPGPGGPVGPYECACGLWHLGRNPLGLAARHAARTAEDGA